MVRTLQVTLTGAVQNIGALVPGLTKCKWVSFFNTAAAAMRVGDANISATRGVPLAATTGSYSPPVPSGTSTFGTDLNQWNVIGTATQLLDVIYDDMNF